MKTRKFNHPREARQVNAAVRVAEGGRRVQPVRTGMNALDVDAALCSAWCGAAGAPRKRKVPVFAHLKLDCLAALSAVGVLASSTPPPAACNRPRACGEPQGRARKADKQRCLGDSQPLIHSCELSCLKWLSTRAGAGRCVAGWPLAVCDGSDRCPPPFTRSATPRNRNEVTCCEKRAACG